MSYIRRRKKTTTSNRKEEGEELYIINNALKISTVLVRIDPDETSVILQVFTPNQAGLGAAQTIRLDLMIIMDNGIPQEMRIAPC